MAPQRIRQIMDEIARAMNAWINEALENNKYKIKKVAEKASINIVLYAGKNDEKIYIGPWHICDQLNKSCPGGRIFRCHHSWCWQNDESFDNIEAVLERYPSNKTLRFKFNNQPEMETLLWEIIGRFETIIPFNFENSSAVIGSWGLCQRLRRHFGGYVAKMENHHWVWGGSTRHRIVTDYIAHIRKLKRHASGVLYDPKITGYYDQLKLVDKTYKKSPAVAAPFLLPK